MNILVLTELFYPYGSGGELATYLYTNLLAKSAHNVTVVTNKFSDEAEKSVASNLTIYRLPLFKKTISIKYSTLGKVNFLFSNLINKLMKWAEIVYIPKVWYSAIPLAKLHGKPVIAHLHAYTPMCPLAVSYNLSKNEPCHRNNDWFCSPKCILTHERTNGRNLREALMSAILNSTVGQCMTKLVALSDSIICVSKAQGRLIAKHVPSMARKLHVIYNPLPVVTEFNGQSDDFGYFGGASLLRGFNILYQALRNVNPEITIHATKLTSLSKDLTQSLRHLGIIAHRKLSTELYRSLYKRIRIVIVPSIWPEPLPYAVSEALLSKRIVIASRVGGIPEQTEGLEGAFLFRSGDFEQLAELIEHVRDLPSEVKAELGNKNKEVFLKKFDNQKISRNFLNLLDKIGTSS